MNKNNIVLSILTVFSGITYATINDYVVIVDKNNNEYLSEKLTNTGEIVCDVTTPLHSEVYKGIDFVQNNSSCKEKIESSLGTIKWKEVPDFSTNEIGSFLSNNCKGIHAFDSSLATGTYPILVNNSEISVECNMTVDGGGWTKIASADRIDAEIGQVNHGVNLNINDKNLEYTEILYFDRDSNSDYGGSNMNDNVWDWQGLDFGKNIFKFGNDWSGMTGKFIHSCNTLPTAPHQPSSSYRVIEHNVSVCFDAGTINKPADCARKVAIKVPQGKRLTGFSDVETVLNKCNSDNRYKQHFDLYVR